MRRLLSLASALSLALLAPSTAWATDAPVVQNNPQGVQYLARYDQKGLVVEIVAQTPLNGTGANFVVNINGNSTALFGQSDYIYHIHDQPVPSDGNCTATLAHLDPYGRGETTPCDASLPASCQVGDLSGKHGVIPSLPGFSKNYTDDYVSLAPGTPAFVGNRSFVLHYPNKTRIACGNFQLVQRTMGDSVGTNGTGAAGNGSVTSGTAAPGSSTTGSTGGIGGLGGVPRGSAGALTPTSGAASASGSAVSGALGLKDAVTERKAQLIGPLVFAIAAAVL